MKFSEENRRKKSTAEKSPYNPKLTAILKKSGWKEGRDESFIEWHYRSLFRDAWVPEAAPFVRSFGHLVLGLSLWVYPEWLLHELRNRKHIERITGAAACPIAASNYMGDGATLWIDSHERFYVADSEGMLFVGEGIATTLGTLLLNEPPPAPPTDIKGAILKAWEWGNPEN